METEAAKRPELQTEFFVRTAEEWRTIIALNPFPGDGTGTSRLTIALIERKLGTRATGRNWNTVLRLNALGES